MESIRGTEMEQIVQIKALRQPALEDLKQCKVHASNEYALASKVGDFHQEYNARFANLEQDLAKAFQDLAQSR